MAGSRPSHSLLRSPDSVGSWGHGERHGVLDQELNNITVRNKCKHTNTHLGPFEELLIRLGWTNTPVLFQNLVNGVLTPPLSLLAWVQHNCRPNSHSFHFSLKPRNCCNCPLCTGTIFANLCLWQRHNNSVCSLRNFRRAPSGDVFLCLCYSSLSIAAIIKTGPSNTDAVIAIIRDNAQSSLFSPTLTIR